MLDDRTTMTERAKMKAGDRFGMLTVTGFRMKQFTNQRFRVAICDCDCGKTGHEVLCHNLNRNQQKSCGCRKNARRVGPPQKVLSSGETFRQAAERIGITKAGLLSRIARLGEEEALVRPRGAFEPVRKYWVGERPAGQVADESGVSRSLMGQRIKAGWSVEDAASIPPNAPRGKGWK